MIKRNNFLELENKIIREYLKGIVWNAKRYNINGIIELGIKKEKR